MSVFPAVFPKKLLRFPFTVNKLAPSTTDYTTITESQITSCYVLLAVNDSKVEDSGQL